MSTTRAQVDLPLSFPHLLFGARARWFSVFAFHGRAASVFSLEFVQTGENRRKRKGKREEVKTETKKAT